MTCATTSNAKEAGRQVRLRLLLKLGAGVVAGAAIIAFALHWLPTREANRALEAARAAVRRDSDPWEQLVTLDRARREALAKPFVTDPEGLPDVLALERGLFDKTLDSGNPLAVTALFSPGDFGAELLEPGLLQKQRHRHLPQLLSVADEAAEGKSSPGGLWAMVRAARMYADGTGLPRDAPKALAMYNAAWTAGYGDAAAGAAQAAAAVGDRVAAYRWALRCSSMCRNESIDLGTYQRGLSPADIKRATDDVADKIIDYRKATP